jgi:hypothetical protein
MIRITIKWNFISPMLQTATGIVEVHHASETVTDLKLIARFQASVKPGSTGYKSIDEKGVPSIVLDGVKTYLDIYLKAFRDGMILEKTSFFWSIPEALKESQEALDKLEGQIEDHDRVLIYESAERIEI